MNIGIDLVELPDFKLRLGQPGILEKLFSSVELGQNSRPESLAGIFAAKEAFFKACGEKFDWLDVWIEKDQNGKPTLSSLRLKGNTRCEVSITHAGEYAAAVVVIYSGD